jgi:hypothetical protein
MGRYERTKYRWIAGSVAHAAEPIRTLWLGDGAKKILAMRIFCPLEASSPALATNLAETRGRNVCIEARTKGRQKEKSREAMASDARGKPDSRRCRAGWQRGWSRGRKKKDRPLIASTHRWCHCRQPLGGGKATARVASNKEAVVGRR